MLYSFYQPNKWKDIIYHVQIESFVVQLDIEAGIYFAKVYNI